MSGSRRSRPGSSAARTLSPMCKNTHNRRIPSTLLAQNPRTIAAPSSRGPATGTNPQVAPATPQQFKVETPGAGSVPTYHNPQGRHVARMAWPSLRCAATTPQDADQRERRSQSPTGQPRRHGQCACQQVIRRGGRTHSRLNSAHLLAGEGVSEAGRQRTIKRTWEARNMVRKTQQARHRIERRNFSIPSPAEVVEKMTPAGAWTAAQLAEWGVPWPPPHGWRRELERRWQAHGNATTNCPVTLPRERETRQQSEITSRM